MKPSLNYALNISNAKSTKQAETLWRNERETKDQIIKAYFKRLNPIE